MTAAYKARRARKHLILPQTLAYLTPRLGLHMTNGQLKAGAKTLYNVTKAALPPLAKAA
jgi:hypothetical protein